MSHGISWIFEGTHQSNEAKMVIPLHQNHQPISTKQPHHHSSSTLPPPSYWSAHPESSSRQFPRKEPQRNRCRRYNEQRHHRPDNPASLAGVDLEVGVIRGWGSHIGGLGGESWTLGLVVRKKGRGSLRALGQAHRERRLNGRRGAKGAEED